MVPALIGNVAHIRHIKRFRQIAQQIADWLSGLVTLMTRQFVDLISMLWR